MKLQAQSLEQKAPRVEEKGRESAEKHRDVPSGPLRNNLAIRFPF
jgi:hypothetical protein